MKVLFILVITLFSSFVSAQQSVANGIEVIGKASIEAKPDHFIFNVLIFERGRIASKTKAIVDQKSRLVIDSYLHTGIDKNAIDSSRLQLSPRYEKRVNVSDFEIQQRVHGRSTPINAKVVVNSKNLFNSDLNEKQKIYFEVSRTITVTFTDFELYDQLLDNAVKIGVSHITPLQSAIADNEALYQQALIKAVENAKQKAQAIAQQIGAKLGVITRLKESSYHAPRAYAMASDSRESFNSQTIKKNITAQVSVNFTIKH
ncbi:MAG: SIMPL domain-containing protein [Colwellia sp.]|nr:SIMPL domain-containing protein [Colwellia sp.]